MMTVKQIKHPDIAAKIAEYRALGGVMEFGIFSLTLEVSARKAHWIAAKQTLELLNEVLSPFTKESGTLLTPQEFFGPSFELETQRPLVGGRGRNFLNDLFYYDEEESFANKRRRKWDGEADAFPVRGYAEAFLNPPHAFGRKTILETGQFFLDFNHLLFGDLNQITAYAWPIDCSDYFDFGKEWWGSFFWTVHNPAQNWYIGIVASTSD
jgi:hypothetical protein